MKGPVPIGVVIFTVGLEAIELACAACSMYSLPRMVYKAVYCAVAKVSVTTLPEAVGADDWAGMPLMFALGFISIL